MGLFTKDKKITGQVITVNVREIDLNPNQPKRERSVTAAYSEKKN